MTWTNAGVLNPSRNWQVTSPVEGEFFRLTHNYSDLPTEYFRAELAQVEVDETGDTSFFEPQIIEASADSQIIQLIKPACFGDRRIAIRQVSRDVDLPPAGRVYSWAIGIETFADVPPPPPEPTGVERLYTSNGDANGVLYFAGTNWGGDATFTNPQSLGTIEITALETLFSTLGNLTDRSPAEYISGSSTFEQWVRIDLKTKKLRPNYYSIRGRNGDVNDLPRSWKLQGSNDGSAWADLDIQENNSSVDSVQEWLSLPVTTTEKYRYFRFLQTAVSNTGRNYLTLGEIELYGTVYDLP